MRKIPSNFLSFICNYYEKDSLKIRKINCNYSWKVRVISINNYLSWLGFSLCVINKYT